MWRQPSCLDDHPLSSSRRVAGRVLSTDAELLALRMGIVQAVNLPDVKDIHIFSDSMGGMNSVLDCSIHSSQAHSLAASSAV